VQGTLSQFRRRLLNWYDRHHRRLPWRGPAVDPYHVLVSEMMLQQTQVATVIPYFQRFIARLPTLADLARADEQEVLRLWQGLGYYSRARNLQRCARKVMTDFAGLLPSDLESLRTLAGVGRYTAGAIASIAFGKRCASLDGNVARVLSRLWNVSGGHPSEPQVREALWARAQEVLPPPRQRIGDFNSALMELGALVCTPRSPQCLLCPVRQHCRALADGAQERIPPPRKPKPATLLKRLTFCIHHRQRWLIEQRPSRGRWAGMWQFITIEAAPGGRGGGVGRKLQRSTLDRLPLPVSQPRALGSIRHALTHRRYEFSVYACRAAAAAAADNDGADRRLSDRPRRWVALSELSRYPLPRPHLRIAQMLHAQNLDR
jgi:A/G-specific adenine glycosylase